MARFNKIANIPIAAHGRHSFPVKLRTLATHRFYEVCPVAYKHLLQGEKVDLKGGAFERTNPLVNAAFVTGNHFYRWFFVPYRTCDPTFVDFQNGSPHPYSDGTMRDVPQAPFINMGNIADKFRTSSDLGNVVPSSAPHDFDYKVNNSTTVSIRLTTIGRGVLKIFNGLGYYFNWTYLDQSRILNARAILAYLKLYCDWYWPSQYTEHAVFAKATKLLSNNTTNPEIDPADLMSCLINMCYSFYSDDLFDHVWDLPFSASGTTESFPAVDMLDINSKQSVEGNYTHIRNNGSEDVNNPYIGTPYIGADNDSYNNVPITHLTQYALDALQGLSNFMRRITLAGSRAVDRFLVARGLKMDPVVANRSVKLEEVALPIHIGDVENNSDTNLGELAGKGVVRTTEDQYVRCEYEASEDGVLILVSSVIPDGGLIQKTDPFNHYNTFYDFYLGEFAKLGIEAVPSDAIFNFLSGDSNLITLGKVFGFWRRYYAYVANRNVVLGDFNLASKGSADLSKYHSFREFLDSSEVVDDLGGPYHSLEFLTAAYDSEQYNRMFYSYDSDNLIALLDLRGTHYSFIPPFADSFDWDDDSFNKRVSVQISGSKVN